jgi:hypothetical protein
MHRLALGRQPGLRLHHRRLPLEASAGGMRGKIVSEKTGEAEIRGKNAPGQ